MEISTSVLRGLVTLLRDRGIDAKTLLQDAGVDDQLLERAQHSVDLNTASRLIEACYRSAHDPSLALRLGAAGPLQTLGVMGELIMHCATLRTCLAEAQTYLPLVLPMGRFRLLEEGERAHFIFEPPFADTFSFRFTTELALAFVVRITRHFVSWRENPLELRLRYAAPRHEAAYRETFACPVKFDAPRNEIVFARAGLDAPQPFPDEPLWRLLKRRADDLLVQERARELLHERVRHVLRHEIDLSSVNPGTIARRLGISPRSLRRRLGDEGHSLSALVDEVRRELSLSELLNPEMPIKRIADRVGFSEVSAFHRAFKRWTGVTPARYRAQTGLAHAS